jgi:hypothetical protein
VSFKILFSWLRLLLVFILGHVFPGVGVLQRALVEFLVSVSTLGGKGFISV